MKHFISSLSVLCANTPPCEGRVSSRKILSLLLILFLSIGNAWGETVTITKTTNTLVSELGWSVSSGNTCAGCYTEFQLDEAITISTTGTPNCGSIWGTTTNDWRLYQTQNGNVIVSAKEGYELVSIKLTYSTSKNGTLKDGSTTTSSNAVVSCSGLKTKTLTVGNTSTDTNGQVRITTFSVTYVQTAGSGSGPVTPTKLSAPANLKEASITETSATLSWDAVANASNYSVTINGNTEAVTTNSYSATGLTAGTEYTWSVVAKGDGTNYTDSDAAQHTFTTTATTPDPEPGTGTNVTYDFTKIDGFSSWGNSYSSHEVTYSDAKVTFEAASKQTSNITDCPVTKGKSVVLVMTDGMNIATVKWVCTQWTTKAQTITLHYSKDGGNVYTSTEITSSDFTISSDNLPVGTNAVKITFNSTSNQVGIKSCTITKVEAAAITQVPAPQFSLPAGAYDGAQSVELTCTMADATIYYTTDGNTPTTSSAVYSNAIQVAENMTIKAYAVKEGLEDSPVAEATYEISAPADVVLDFTTNDTWNFPTEKTVTATDYSNGDYTVTVAGSEGQGFMFDNTNKNLMIGKEGSYIMLPIFNKPIVKIVCEGHSSGSGSVTFNVFVGDDAVSTAVTSCKAEQTFLIAEDKQVANVAHVIKVTNANNLRIAKIKIYLGEAPAVERPVIGGEEEFAVSTEVSITCATSGAKIYYTTDGTEPTNARAEYTAPFELSATTSVKAIAYADGQVSAVVTKTFTFIETITCVQAAEIALAQSANNVQTEKKYRIVAYVTETLSGVSSNQQSFKVVDNIGDESVFQSYYCNVPEAMAAGMKVEMIGKLSKYNDAAQMKNGNVTILEKPVAAPKILGVEAFETSTEVTITAEEGMQIYYTLDGTTPTTGSTQYTAAFTVSATTTVKAIAYNSTTAKSSAVTEKTFTKTIIPTKTVAEFIAAGGTRCYLEGIVSGLTEGNSMKYGNFDLTDASGKIYVYGCLNAAGESQKFAELGVKNGDKIKVIADVYDLYNGTEEAKNVQYVSHVSAASITIADITMEVGETKTIAATITPDAAKTEVTYSIKAGSDDCITLSENNITAKAEGTATIVATIATAEGEYMGKTVEFEVTVTPKSTKEKVVILAQYEGKWYAMKAQYVTGKTSHLAPLSVTYFDGKLYNVSEEDKALIEWECAVVDGKATFYNDGKYLTGKSGDTDLTLAATACEWTISGDSYLIDARTFLYNAENNWFRNFGTSNAGNKNYSDMPTVTAPVYATGDIVYTRDVTPGNYGTICLPYASDNFTGATFFEVAGKEGDKVFFDEVTTLEAGKPYIFMAEETEIKVTQIGESAVEAGKSNSLQGTFTQIAPAVDNVLVGNYMVVNNVIKKCGANCGLKAYRAYFIAGELETLGTPSALAPGRKRIAMGTTGAQVATGVDQVQGDEVPTKMIINGQLFILRGEKMYDAQGKLVK